jgi:hypothetical protein
MLSGTASTEIKGIDQLRGGADRHAHLTPTRDRVAQGHCEVDAHGKDRPTRWMPGCPEFIARSPTAERGTCRHRAACLSVA